MKRRLAIAASILATTAIAQNYENYDNANGENYGNQGNNYGQGENYENQGENYEENAQGSYGNNAEGNYGNNAQGNDYESQGNFGNQGNDFGNANLNSDLDNNFGSGNSSFGTNYGNGSNLGGSNYAPANNAATGNVINGGANYAPPANAATGQQPGAPAQPAPPPSPFAPGPKELSFQIDQNGTLSLHRFIMKWPAPEANLQAIEVINSETDELVQTITIPQDRVRLVYQDVMRYQKSGDRLKEKILDLKDYNFDNYGDLRLLAKWPYKVGEKQYLVMIFHPLDLKYRINEAISALKAPLPNPKTYRIESTTLQGWGGGEYTTDFYSIDKKGRLTLQKRYSHTILDRIKGTFVRDVRLRIGGEMQRVCKIVFPAEGVPRRVWGNKRLCQKFAKKYDRK